VQDTGKPENKDGTGRMNCSGSGFRKNAFKLKKGYFVVKKAGCNIYIARCKHGIIFFRLHGIVFTGVYH
jgi:hypothetical protein